MSPASKRVAVEIEGRELSLSNLDKVLYPDSGFTKGAVIDYYTRIAPTILPHLAGRAITLVRFPNGVDGMNFFEKNCPSHRPEWMETVRVVTKNKDVSYCLLAETADLVWTANLAALELHPSLWVRDDIDEPTFVVFDLDPGAPADILDCIEVGQWVREVLDHLGLRCYAKTSGSKGLQVYVPLNTPCDFEASKSFALALGQLLEKQHPDRVVTNMAKELRPGKVLVDWSQNTQQKTTVCVYSLRARVRPWVSTPVTWDELDRALTAGDPELLRFEAGDVLERVEELGDLMAPVLTDEQELPSLGR